MKNKIARVISMLIAASTLSASLASCSWNEVRETKSMLQKYREYDVSSDEYGYDIDLTEYILAPSYLGIEIPDISYSPSEADIENYTALKQAYFSDEERVNEPAQKYDFVDCEYSAVLYFSGEDTDETAEDDEGATERKSYNYSLFDSSVDNSRTSVMVGVDHFMVPEIDDAMIGMKPGESKTVEFTLPEPYYKDVMSSGLSGEFTIKVNHVRRNDLAEFTDEFVTDHYGAASVESYRDTMVQELVHNMENYYNGYEYDLLEDYLASNTMVYKYPSAQLNAERDAIYDSYRDRAESAGMTLDDYIVSIGYSDSADFFDSYVDPQARLKIREDMIFLFVARCEGLTVSQSEYEDALTAEGSEYDASDISTCEEIVVKKYGSILRFKQQVQNSKVMDFIKDNASRIDPEVYYANKHAGSYKYTEAELTAQNNMLYEKVTTGDGKVSYNAVGEAKEPLLTPVETAVVVLLVMVGIAAVAAIVYLSVRLKGARAEQKRRIAEEAALAERRRIRREIKQAKKKRH